MRSPCRSDIMGCEFFFFSVFFGKKNLPVTSNTSSVKVIAHQKSYYYYYIPFVYCLDNSGPGSTANNVSHQVRLCTKVVEP